jgi:hypothetical protein
MALIIGGANGDDGKKAQTHKTIPNRAHTPASIWKSRRPPIGAASSAGTGVRRSMSSFWVSALRGSSER